MWSSFGILFIPFLSFAASNLSLSFFSSSQWWSRPILRRHANRICWTNCWAMLTHAISCCRRCTSKSKRKYSTVVPIGTLLLHSPIFACLLSSPSISSSHVQVLFVFVFDLSDMSFLWHFHSPFFSPLLSDWLKLGQALARKVIGSEVRFVWCGLECCPASLFDIHDMFCRARWWTRMITQPNSISCSVILPNPDDVVVVSLSLALSLTATMYWQQSR